MKIAKKMLAVVVALVMVASLSAMAFAAGAEIKLVPGEIYDKKGEKFVDVSFVIVNGEGGTSFDASVHFDDDVLELVNNKEGEPKFSLSDVAKACNNDAGAGIDASVGRGDLNLPDLAKFAGYVKVTSGLTAFTDDDDEPIPGVDPNNFDFGFITFKIKEGAKGTTELTVDGLTEGLTCEGARIVISAEEQPTSEENPSEEQPTSEENPSEEKPSEVKPTDAANPNTGDKNDDKNTGDTVVLAAVAGVVALAGAAFVISKKRK